MGALSNSGRKTANFTGFYKGIQSAGAAICWSIDSRKASYDAQFFSCWGLLMFSLVCAAPVILRKIKNTTPVEEDLKDTDETVGDVLPIEKMPDASVGVGHGPLGREQQGIDTKV